MDILFYERMSGDMGKLACIDNEDVEDFLTVGKTYGCKNNDGQFVDILDDTHEFNTYVVERFEEE